ncbi:MAG: ABC transporter ATP-binding protein [Clostridia bacterium]|nr:ABC transporter ATP-binding protein [Clostridia bacterium]
MIEIKSVTKNYGNFTAIENINLVAENSSILGIVGFNGCGKTTLLNICAGIYKPDNGQALLDGSDAFDNNNERCLMFYLSDNLWFPASSSVKGAAKYYASYYPFFDFRIFSSICEIFGLKERAGIRSLSKGMKKQASLAIAFAAKPRYLLIDETFDGLDPQKKEILKKLLLEYINETGASVIIASHDLNEISGVCDHIAIINGKNVILNCAIDDVSDHFRRVNLTFENNITEEAFADINYRKLRISGKTVSMIICGDIPKEIEKLNAKGYLNIDTTRLTLEEVFIEETEAENKNEKINSVFRQNNR